MQRIGPYQLGWPDGDPHRAEVLLRMPVVEPITGLAASSDGRIVAFAGDLLAFRGADGVAGALELDGSPRRGWRRRRSSARS